ncbi:MAG: hypothetical protein RLZZ91_893 [Bacteroidota bacterium]
MSSTNAFGECFANVCDGGATKGSEIILGRIIIRLPIFAEI